MSALLLLASMAITQTWQAPTPDSVIVGQITRYDEGLMEQVLVNRGIITDVSVYDAWLTKNDYDGVTALRNKGDVGRVVWIRGRRLYVGDCRQLRHYPGLFAAELDYETAMELLAEGPWPGEVAISFSPPSSRRQRRMR